MKVFILLFGVGPRVMAAVIAICS